MEYKIFINKIYIKNAWMSKDELSMHLFLSAVNNESSITEKRNSSEAFKGYNRGNSIAEIAGDVMRDLNQDGIKTFLKDTFDSKPDKKAKYVQKICEKFKDDIPDITAENICEKISAFFIDEVLRPAVKENKKEDTATPHPLNSAQTQGSEPTTDVDDSTEQDNDSLHNTNHTENFYDNHTDNYNIKTTSVSTTNINATHKNVPTSDEDLKDNWYSQLEPPSPSFSESTLSCIEEIVRKMLKKLTEIADLNLDQYIENSNPTHLSFLSKDTIIHHNKKCIPDEIYNMFLGYYSELHELSIDLKYYSEIYTYSPLNDATNSFASINQNNYLLPNSIMYQTPFKVKLLLLSYAIHKLRK